MREEQRSLDRILMSQPRGSNLHLSKEKPPQEIPSPPSPWSSSHGRCNVFLTKTKYLWLAGLLSVALVTAGAVQYSGSRGVTVPEGTPIGVRLDHSLATNQNRPGDVFTATVAEPIIVDGKTAIPKGATATGRVQDVREAGRLKGVARMRLELTSIEVDGQSYDVQTGAALRRGGNHKKRNWYSIGGSAAGGALIGGLAGGGKGVLIGGPIGAGAGLTYALLTGKKDIKLPAETPLSFTLEQPVKVKAS
jgi:hypothetical protein